MINFYNAILMFLLFIISSHTIDAYTSPEAENFVRELNSKNNEYYSGEKLIKQSEIKAIIDQVENSGKLTDEEKLFLKIEAYTLWANTSPPLETFEKDYPILKEIYKSIKDKAFRSVSLSSEVYASYADFAGAMIPLANLHDDAYSYIFMLDAEEYARIALIKDPHSIKASILYGISFSTINYKYNDLYSKSLKFMGSTENLPEYMVFRTHIYKSMMYMKVNETEKAFEELKKAENIYPNAFFVSMLTISYANGEDGFTGSESSTVYNFQEDKSKE